MALRIPSRPPDSVPPPGNAPLLQLPTPLPRPDDSVPEWRKAGYLIQSLQDEIEKLKLDNFKLDDQMGADKIDMLEEAVEVYRLASLEAELELQKIKDVAGSPESLTLLEANEQSNKALIRFHIAENEKLSYLVSRVSQDLEYLNGVITEAQARNTQLKKECEEEAKKRAATGQSLRAPLVVDATWKEAMRSIVPYTQKSEADEVIRSLQEQIKRLQLDNPVKADEMGVLEANVNNYRTAYLRAEIEVQEALKSALSLEIQLFRVKDKSDKALINFYIAENKRLTYLVARVSEDLGYLRDVIRDISRRNINLKKDCTDSAEKRAPTGQSLTEPLVVDASWLEGVRRAVTRSQRVLGQ